MARKQTITRSRRPQSVPGAARSEGQLANSGATKRSDGTSRPSVPPHAIVRPLSVFLRWVRLELHQRIVDAIGLSVDRSAVLILETLHEHGPMRMSDLADKIRLDRSTISRQVTAVTEAGLVDRTPDRADGRVSVLALTTHGQMVRHKVMSAWTAIAVGLIADWPSEDQVELVRLMSKLAQQMESVDS